MTTDPTSTNAWQQLRAHQATMAQRFDLRQAFAVEGARRFAAFSQQAPHLFADLSKNLIDEQAQHLLLELAKQCGVLSWRDAMFSGDAINNTEHRAAMHWLLRTPADDTVPDTLREALHQTHRTLEAMLTFAEAMRADPLITDVVSIGIGGSSLGPEMACLALQHLDDSGKRFHFVSNVDSCALESALRQTRPHSALFLIASKTFTTAETMTNARAARQWFQQNGGVDLSRHFIALSSNTEAARSFGIERIFSFAEWVGGRFSLWSSIGLALAIAVGSAHFRALLSGAHRMDAHFRTAPPEQNLPLRLGLLDVWYRNFFHFPSRCLAPYQYSLRRLPAWLQQLEMESNGKNINREGAPLHCRTAPVIWGEPGTDCQHAFFQMLHQGSDIIPVEFIATRQPAAQHLGAHHTPLLSNALAQARALMQGCQDAPPHRRCPGNRPSTFLLLDQPDAASLGALLALYEHRVFVSGAIWGINSFDQWGVELGKRLAGDMEPRLRSGDADGLDASTAGLLQRLM